MTQEHCTKLLANGKVVGAISGDTLRKIVHKNHYLRYPKPALAIDAGALEQAEQMGVTIVEVVDVDCGAIFRSSLEHLREAGTSIDRGYGLQISLPLTGWTRSCKGSADVNQLSFLGGAS